MNCQYDCLSAYKKLNKVDNREYIYICVFELTHYYAGIGVCVWERGRYRETLTLPCGFLQLWLQRNSLVWLHSWIQYCEPTPLQIRHDLNLIGITLSLLTFTIPVYWTFKTSYTNTMYEINKEHKIKRKDYFNKNVFVLETSLLETQRFINIHMNAAPLCK